MEDSDRVKLLLLGAGESGKSTIFKQMKILYGAALTSEEQLVATPIVYNNLMTTMHALLDIVSKLNVQDTLVATEEALAIQNLPIDTVVDPTVGKQLSTLWKDPAILHAWSKRAQFQVVESVQYYFANLDRIADPAYMATQQDMLYARVRTSGIVEERYIIDGAEFVMYDVGGQRNERKKWIHCFEDVTAVIFVAALSEYDQVLLEDETQNRMVEAIDLFDEINNNKYFTKSAMMLFLNKRDLFQMKINKVDPADVKDFEDYSGGIGNYDAGVEYFLKKFTARNKVEGKEIYAHATIYIYPLDNAVFTMC
jgi:GTPase SAR1 family protein